LVTKINFVCITYFRRLLQGRWCLPSLRRRLLYWL